MLNFNFLLALMALIATALAVAIPQSSDETPTTGGVGPLVPESVEVMYYQPPFEPTSTSCVSLSTSLHLSGSGRDEGEITGSN